MLERNLERLIFFSRWIQMPVYLGLIAASLLYAFKFMLHLWHLITDFHGMDENTIMLSILGLVDISMVINLLVVVIIGGYYTFVSKIDFRDHEDRPEWLAKINASTLKIKLIVSLVSISGVHLLKTFIDISNISVKEAAFQIAIHIVFIISALLLAWTDRIMHADEMAMEHQKPGH
jgi:uncharacterized protein (TIGR00645 family)